MTATIGRTPAECVQQAVAALGQGRIIVIVDDPDREDEADLVVPAGMVTEQQIAFMIRHTSGIVCAAMSVERADALGLPMMVSENTDPHATAFTVSVDHVGTGTGVSAVDRARTLRALADPATAPAQLRRPGHIFPLRARAGGVLVRAGHTEAAVDLVEMAGFGSVAVIGELSDDDGSMLRGARLRAFIDEHALVVVSVADIIRFRRVNERQVEQVAVSALPTTHGEFRAVAYRGTVDGVEHLAMVVGDVVAASRSSRGVLVRIHSECLTGDILGSLRCDCGAQLQQALAAIAAEGCGVVVYLRGHEGRGIGLAHKIRAYALQDGGLDTVDANTAQGLPVDSRTYGVGAQILLDLGVTRLRLITNNPLKYGGLDGYGIEIVERVGLPSSVNPHNVKYLHTKRARMGHLLGAAES